MSKIQSDTEHLILNADGSGKEVRFQNNGTQNVVIDSSGNVGIGTASPGRTLAVNAGTANTPASFTSTDANCNISFIDDSTTSDGYVSFGCTGDDAVIRSGNAESVRIDSGGNLLVGKTSGDITSAGVELRSDGLTQITRSGNKPLLLNRKTSNGDIAVFQKDGTTVGIIGVGDGDNLYITGSAGSTKGLYFNDNTVGPAANGYNGSDATTNLGASSYRFKDLYLSGRVLNVGDNNRTVELLGTDAGGNHRGLVVGAGAVGVNSDNSIDLGSSSYRFKDFYLSGGVYVGGTGSANYLDDYEEGTFTPTLVGTISNPSYTGAYEGRYIKIGKLVNFSLFIDTNPYNTDGSGRIRVGNLPFTVDGTNGGGYPNLFVSVWGPTLGSGNSLAGIAIDNGNYIQFRLWGDNRNMSWWEYSAASWSSGDAIYISGHYFTD